MVLVMQFKIVELIKLLYNLRDKSITFLLSPNKYKGYRGSKITNPKTMCTHHVPTTHTFYWSSHKITKTESNIALAFTLQKTNWQKPKHTIVLLLAPLYFKGSVAIRVNNRGYFYQKEGMVGQCRCGSWGHAPQSEYTGHELAVKEGTQTPNWFDPPFFQNYILFFYFLESGGSVFVGYN